MRRIVLIAALAVAAAGCGGSGSTLYTAQKSEECLAKVPGAKIDHGVDFVASTATGGAFHAQLASTNAVTVVFGASVEDANNIHDAYVRFRSKNVGIDDVLRQQGNAVMLWHAHPDPSDENVVDDCLSG